MLFSRGYKKDPITPAQVSLIEDIEETLDVEYDWKHADKWSAHEFISKYKKAFDIRCERNYLSLHGSCRDFDDDPSYYLEYNEV